MNRKITVLSVCLLLSLIPLAAMGQVAKKPQWKSRAEYDAFQAMLKGTTPQQKIQLANAFLTKYPNSDFKAQADNLKVQEYQTLNQVNHAVAAAQDSLKADPADLFTLNYLSYIFPYLYKPSAPGSATQLSQIQSEAKQGLQLLQQEQKPPTASQQQFEAAIKQSRANFNRALGFAALQQKDFANAITYLEAAIQDNPNDSYAVSFLGQAYLYSTPPDYNSALWYLARAVALAKQGSTPNLAGLTKLYSQWYEFRHGSNAGEQALIAQSAASANPPSGFNVAPPPKHAKTGDVSVDAFYGIQDSLSVGGDAAQAAWSQYKGQPLGIVAFVDDVSPGDDPDTYVVKADVLPSDRGKSGIYNMVLDTSQPDARYLRLGDPIHFQGTISAYTVTPSFVLTLSDTKIDQQKLNEVAERAKAAAAAKAAHKRPVRRR